MIHYLVDIIFLAALVAAFCWALIGWSRATQTAARRSAVMQIPVEIMIDGDVLVLQTEKVLSLGQLDRIKQNFEVLYSAHPPKMIVLESGLSLSILRRSGGPIPPQKAYLVGEQQP